MGKTCKYVMAHITQTNLDTFRTYGYAPFSCVCLAFCAAEFESSGGIYELPCIMVLVKYWKNFHPVEPLITDTVINEYLQ